MREGTERVGHLQRGQELHLGLGCSHGGVLGLCPGLHGGWAAARRGVHWGPANSAAGLGFPLALPAGGARLPPHPPCPGLPFNLFAESSRLPARPRAASIYLVSSLRPASFLTYMSKYGRQEALIWWQARGPGLASELDIGGSRVVRLGRGNARASRYRPGAFFWLPPCPSLGASLCGVVSTVFLARSPPLLLAVPATVAGNPRTLRPYMAKPL